MWNIPRSAYLKYPSSKKAVPPNRDTAFRSLSTAFPAPQRPHKLDDAHDQEDSRSPYNQVKQRVANV